MFFQYMASGLSNGCLYALVGIGFALVYGSTRVFHVAHGCVLVAAGYGALVIHSFAGVSMWISVIAGICLATGLGIGVEWCVYRPLERRGATWNVFFAASLGVYILITNALAAMFGNATQPLRVGICEPYHFGSLLISQVDLLKFACLLVAVLALWVFLSKTKMGISIRALSDNPHLASALGNDPGRTRTVIFLVASLLAAVAGVIRAYELGVQPQMGLSMMLTGAVAAMLAGKDSPLGAAVGGLVIGLAQAMVVWFTSAQWQEMATFVILAAILLLRPEGLFRVRRRAEQL